MRSNAEGRAEPENAGGRTFVAFHFLRTGVCMPIQADAPGKPASEDNRNRFALRHPFAGRFREPLQRSGFACPRTGRGNEELFRLDSRMGDRRQRKIDNRNERREREDSNHDVKFAQAAAEVQARGTLT